MYYIDVFPGSIGGQLLNGAEGGSDNTSLNNVGNSNCDNNTTTNNHANNRNITGQNTPDGKYIHIIIHIIILCLLLLIISKKLCKFSNFQDVVCRIILAQHLHLGVLQ